MRQGHHFFCTSPRADLLLAETYLKEQEGLIVLEILSIFLYTFPQAQEADTGHVDFDGSQEGNKQKPEKDGLLRKKE